MGIKAAPNALDGQLTERLRAAERALHRLNLAGEMVPSLDWFTYAFVRKRWVQAIRHARRQP